MSKAYDRLEWSFIRKVLLCLGFCMEWTEMIIRCCSTVSYSFLLNDSTHGLVLPSRGIRQGDPLSPYLFILCSEVLSGLCLQAQHSGHLTGVRAARRSPRINHLLFADDTMFFLKTDEESCEALMHILRSYEQASGQMINVNKSSITFSTKTPQETRSRVKYCLGIVKEGGVGKYLGLPEHFGRRKKDFLTSIVDMIQVKAKSLSTRRLSPAGKLVMLKAV